MSNRANYVGVRYFGPWVILTREVWDELHDDAVYASQVREHCDPEVLGAQRNAARAEVERLTKALVAIEKIAFFPTGDAMGNVHRIAARALSGAPAETEGT